MSLSGKNNLFMKMGREAYKFKICRKKISIFLSFNKCTAPDRETSHTKVLSDVIDKIVQQVYRLLRMGKYTKILEQRIVMPIVNKEKKMDSLQARRYVFKDVHELRRGHERGNL